MRVVAGSARSIVLETPAGNNTRPTTDRIKETLFNILMPYVPGSIVLDLFAGSGGLGIECLSRGAEFATFVDAYRPASECIKHNLAKTHFNNKSEMLIMDFENALSNLKRLGRKYDLVILDPPYDKGLEFSALRIMADYDLLAEDALVVVETSKEHDPEEFINLGFSIKKIKDYKSNRHYFLEK
ncbi:MAG: 16S rRNA (guanine(966)-N(2))-methyltransferase RsmD [Clostridiales bacterium]|nr:16S rRNA (guanine(966)-N(2))-methyltransferase RsmD [Clostridiales bacterium]